MPIFFLVALDVADRAGFESFRSLILKRHTEYPMTWRTPRFWWTAITTTGCSRRLSRWVDLDKEWTMILFSQPGPWSSHRDDGLSESPERTLMAMEGFAAARPAWDVKVMLAILGGDHAVTRAALLAGRSKIDCPVLSIPGGSNNPLVHRLGLLSEDRGMHSVLIHKDGRIASFLSGLAKQSGRGA